MLLMDASMPRLVASIGFLPLFVVMADRTFSGKVGTL